MKDVNKICVWFNLKFYAKEERYMESHRELRLLTQSWHDKLCGVWRTGNCLGRGDYQRNIWYFSLMNSRWWANIRQMTENKYLPHFAPMDIPIARQGQNLSARCWPSVRYPGGWDMWVIFFPSVLCSVTQSCSTVCDILDFTPPGSSVHGIFQARILERVAIPSSKGSSQPRDLTRVFCTAGRFFATEPPREPLFFPSNLEVFSVCDKAKIVFSLDLNMLYSCWQITCNCEAPSSKRWCNLVLQNSLLYAGVGA